MGEHNLWSKLDRSHMPASGQAFYIPGVGYCMGWGTTVGNGIEGWAPGAIFVHTDGSAGTTNYINEGSVTTASFAAVAALTAAQEALLSATAGTLAASKAIIVNSDSHIDVLNTASLKLGATGATVAVTATAAELNALAGVTAGTAAASKGLVLNASGTVGAGTLRLEDMTEGAGISSATGETCEHSVVKTGGLIVTTIVVDLAGLNSGGTDGDIIGKDGGTANCHIGQITAAKNGTIFAGKVTCLEVPAGGSDDVDLFAGDEATGAEDAARSGLTNGAAIVDAGGAWTLALAKAATAYPAANQYLYLTGNTGDASYTAGIFEIVLYGK